MEKHPRVGVGVIIERNGKIILGERISSHGAGTFQIPGGHLEFGETFEETAVREAQEETGLKDFEIKGIVSINNDIAYDKHYVTVGILLHSPSGEPTNPEPTHSRNWHWHDPYDLPEPMFPHSKKVVENWLSGNMYNKN